MIDTCIAKYRNQYVYPSTCLRVKFVLKLAQNYVVTKVAIYKEIRNNFFICDRYHDVLYCIYTSPFPFIGK